MRLKVLIYLIYSKRIRYIEDETLIYWNGRNVSSSCGERILKYKSVGFIRIVFVRTL